MLCSICDSAMYAGAICPRCSLGWRTPDTLCVECGPDVRVDEDGCCETCGAQATGSWLVQAVRTLSDDLDDLEQKARAALPGQWAVCRDGASRPCVEITQLAKDGTIYGAELWSPDLDDGEPSNPRVEACAAHIAAASPEVVLRLIARIRELEATLDEFRQSAWERSERD